LRWQASQQQAAHRQHDLILPRALRLGCRRLCSVGLCCRAPRSPATRGTRAARCVCAGRCETAAAVMRTRAGRSRGRRATHVAIEGAVLRSRGCPWRMPFPKAAHSSTARRAEREACPRRPILCSPALASAGSEAADGPLEGSAPQLACRRGMCGLRRVAHNDAQGRRSSCRPLRPRRAHVRAARPSITNLYRALSTRRALCAAPQARKACASVTPEGPCSRSRSHGRS